MVVASQWWSTSESNFLQVEEDERKKKRMERFNMKTSELSTEVCSVKICVPRSQAVWALLPHGLGTRLPAA